MSGAGNQIDPSGNAECDQDALQQEIDSLKQRAEKLKRGEPLNESELSRIRNFEQQEKFNRIEHHYNKKGIMHFWYVKVPLRVLNVGSIKDSNKLLVDSYRSLTSRVCPLCGQGILMFNRSAQPVNGAVLWFCSKQPVCNYEVFGPPSDILELNPKINSIVDQDAFRLGKGRWEALTQEEKEDLISSHLDKAKIYRAFALFMAMMCVLQLSLFISKSSAIFLFTSLFIFALSGYLALISIHWAYRAWQIKTGNVFLPEAPFLSWLKTAEKYYSVDWVDETKMEN